MANGLSRKGNISGTRASSKVSIWLTSGSRDCVSRPGSCIAQTSISDGNFCPQFRKADAPPPAGAKQKSREKLLGAVLNFRNQRDGTFIIDVSLTTHITMGVHNISRSITSKRVVTFPPNLIEGINSNSTE